MKLILLRHGKTVWNKDHRLQGQSNSPITKEGLIEVEKVAKYLKNEKIDEIYCSSLKRTYVTAKEITKSHKKLKIKKLKALNEISYGKLEGMNFSEIDKNFPEEWAKRMSNKYLYRLPGGENYKDLEKRIKSVLKMIKKKHKKETIVIVAHLNVNRVILKLLLQLRRQNVLNAWQPHNCIYFIHKTEKGTKLWHELAPEGKKTKGLFTQRPTPLSK